jgi:Putative DNA-binding domain
MIPDGMFLNGRSLEKINYDWLEQCRKSGIEESGSLEFKEKGPVFSGSQQADKRDFLQDVCAFTNAGGGLILYGIRGEKSGNQNTLRMSEICGFDPGIGFSEYKNRLLDLAREGFDPRFGALDAREIRNPDGSPPVIAVGVERSNLAPHRVTSNESREFMMRVGPSSIKMNVDLIRHAIVSSIDARSRAERALDEALFQFLNSPQPIPDSSSLTLFAGLCPTYAPALALPMRDKRIAEILESNGQFPRDSSRLRAAYDEDGVFLGPYNRSTATARLYRDGMLAVSRWVESSPAVQPGGIRANGRTADTWVPGWISGRSLRDALSEAITFMVRVRDELAMSGPCVLKAVLHGAGDGRGVPNFYPVDPRNSMGVMSIPPAPGLIRNDRLARTVEVTDAALPRALKDLADFFWQASGHQECAGVNEDGNVTAGMRSE